MKQAKLLLIVDGQSHPITIHCDQPLQIGSAPECDICLDGEGIAPQHGTLTWSRGKRLRLRVHPDLPPLRIGGRAVSDEVVELPSQLEVGGQQLRLDIQLPTEDKALPSLPPVPSQKKAALPVPPNVAASHARPEEEPLKGISAVAIWAAFGCLTVIVGGAYGWLHWKRNAAAKAVAATPESVQPAVPEETKEQTILTKQEAAPPMVVVEEPPPVVRPAELAAPYRERLIHAGRSLDAAFERSSVVDVAVTLMTHTGTRVDASQARSGDQDERFATALVADFLAQSKTGARREGPEALWSSLAAARDEIAAVMSESEKLENAAARQLITEHRGELAAGMVRRLGGVISTASYQVRRDTESARREALQIVEEAGAFQAKQAKAGEQMKEPLAKFRQGLKITEMLLVGDLAVLYETLLAMQKQLMALTLDGHPEWEQIDSELRPKVAVAEQEWLSVAATNAENARSSIDQIADAVHQQARYWTAVKAGLEDRVGGKITTAARTRADQALPDLRGRMVNLIAQAGKIESPDDRTEALVALMIKIADGFQAQEQSKGTIPWWGAYPEQRTLVGEAAKTLRNTSLSAHDQAVCDVLAAIKLSDGAAPLPSENTASLHLPVWLGLDASIARLADPAELAAVASYAKEHGLERAMLRVISSVSSQQRNEQQTLFGNDESTRRIFYEDQIGPSVPAAVIQAAAVMHSHNLVLDALATQASRVLRSLSLPELSHDQLPNPHRIPAFPGEVVQEIRKLGDGLRRASALVPTSSAPVIPKVASTDSLKPPPPTKEAPPTAAVAGTDPAPPPAGFWKLDQMFEGTPYQAYSSNGKRFLLHLAQQSLKEAGLYSGGVDGIPGGATYAGFVAYQKRQNLPVTGRFDGALLEALDLQGMPDLRDWTPENDLRATSGRPAMQRPPAPPPPGPGPPSPAQQLLRRAAEVLIQRGIQELQR